MARNEVKKYIIRPLRGLWVVYRVAGNDEIRVATYQTKEEALRACDSLKGRMVRRNPDSWFEFFMNSFNK